MDEAKGASAAELAAEVRRARADEPVLAGPPTTSYRLSRFVRRSLAFSKCLLNHIGLLWNFIHHYNASLPI